MLNFYVIKTSELDPTEVITIENILRPEEGDYVEIPTPDPSLDKSDENVSPKSFSEAWGSTSIWFKILALTGVLAILTAFSLCLYCCCYKKLSEKSQVGYHNGRNYHDDFTFNSNNNEKSNDSNNEVDQNFKYLKNLNLTLPPVSAVNNTSKNPHHHHQIKNPIKAEVPKFVSKEDIAREYTQSQTQQAQQQHNVSSSRLNKSLIGQQDSATTSVSSNNINNISINNPHHHSTHQIAHLSHNKRSNLTASQEILANFSTNSPSPVVPLDQEPGPHCNEFVKGYKKVTRF